MQIWIASRGGMITAFDAGTREALTSVDVGHQVAAMARDGDRLVAVGGRHITTWTALVPEERESGTLPGPARTVAPTPSGPVVLCTGRRPVLVWPDSGLEVRVGHQAQALAHGHDSLWLARQSRPATLERRHVSTGAVEAEIEVHRDPQAVACGPTWVWLATDGPGGLDRIDPRTNAVAGTVETDRQPSGVIEALGAVWIVHGSVPRLTRVDPDALSVVATVRVGAGGFGIGVAQHELWLTQTLASKVCVVDARRAGVRARFDWDEPCGIC